MTEDGSTEAPRLTLTDGGIETALMHHEGIDLACFAAFPLVETPAGEAALRRYFAPFLALARERNVGLALSAPTWRANADRGDLLGYDASALAAANRRCVVLLDELRRDAGATRESGFVVEGIIGPRVDGYEADTAMSSADAERYHAAQVAAFADAPADQVTALTIAYADEAIGIVRAAQARRLPVAISFTVETDGRLPSGETLGDAIAAVDRETDGAASHFLINCAHPTHFADALADGDPAWLDRIGGLRANASTRSHAEMDAADDLDEGDPTDLANRYVELRALLPNLAVVGGCCGTDIRHVTAICDALERDRPRRQGA